MRTPLPSHACAGKRQCQVHCDNRSLPREFTVRRITFAWFAVFSSVLLAGAGRAEAEDISGVIATTKVIYEDSRLVGDVTCTTAAGPCIDFGVSGITLRLNGFTMTGPGNPDATPDPANPG